MVQMCDGKMSGCMAGSMGGVGGAISVCSEGGWVAGWVGECVDGWRNPEFPQKTARKPRQREFYCEQLKIWALALMFMNEHLVFIWNGAYLGGSKTATTRKTTTTATTAPTTGTTVVTTTVTVAPTSITTEAAPTRPKQRLHTTCTTQHDTTQSTRHDKRFHGTKKSRSLEHLHFLITYLREIRPGRL